MKKWSLKGRLTAVSTIIVMIAFYAVYIVTKSAYVNATQARIQDSLTAQIYALMAVAEDYNAELNIPPILRNDRLNHLNSGLVAYVLDVDGDLIWRSKSSDTFAVLPDINATYSLTNLSQNSHDGHQMFWIGDKIIWEHENGMEGEYLFLIGEDKAIMREQVNEFRTQISIWLWVTTIIIVVVLNIAMRISLKPLKNAQEQIEKVREGDKSKVEGDFPKELEPLTSSINSLLEVEALQKRRYRDSLGNLAHSLKTPLAVMKSELQQLNVSESREQLAKQVARVDDIVKYQLNRSVISAGQTMRRKSLIEPEVYKIIDALNKVHAAKALSIEAELESDASFPGEPGDLMELVGNLADNACKWAASKVLISVDEQFAELFITVEDDGPGIPEEKRELILNRGKRLDQQAEGQGLGLSIVMDIIKTYRGNIHISSSDLGGARFKIAIPIKRQ